MTITAQIIADSISPEVNGCACTKCRVVQPAHRFQLYKGKPTGQCRSCKTLAMKAKRLADGIPVRTLSVIGDGVKKCTSCLTSKPFDRFSPSSRGRGGLAAHCKECFAARPKNSQTVRETTAAYRERHRERWRSLHRLAMFKRRHSIAAASDGTVTDAVLEAIYAKENCCYCENPTPTDKRTVEHVIPLSRGGMHSISNLDMACFSCNSAKAAKLPQEFLRKST